MTIELLPGTRLAPDVHLHMCLQNMQGVKGVIVVKIGEHGAVDISTSNITVSELAFASLNLQLYTADVVNGRPPEGTDLIKPPGAA